MHSQVSVFLNAFRELSAITYAFANAAKMCRCGQNGR